MAYVENRGARIYWEEHGAGEPVLLIQGLGYTIEMWHRTIPRLADRYRVIAFDNRGVGRSDVPSGPYAIPVMAADAAAVLTAAGEASAHVLGLSMGGYIAQELALSAPERVRSLVLASTGCAGPEAVLAEREVLEKLVARATMTPEQGIKVLTPYIYAATTPRERIEEDLAIRLRTFPSAEGYLAQLAGVATWVSFSRLGRIGAPTLVMHGDSDRLVPPANGQLLAREIAGARLLMLQNASHVFFTDQPEVAHQAILDFLAQADSARPEGKAPGVRQGLP